MANCPSARPQLHKSAGLWQQCTCAVLGGLLCSSCCVVQLALNSLSIGCAGFAVLTPFRLYLLSITAASLTGTHLRYRNTRRTALAVAIALGLSITPEIVQLYNENKFSQWAGQLLSGKNATVEAPERLHLRVEGMKCLACCARVKSHVLANTGARSCEVELETGSLWTEGVPRSSADAVLNSIQHLGYKAEVLDDSDRTSALQ